MSRRLTARPLGIALALGGLALGVGACGGSSSKEPDRAAATQAPGAATPPPTTTPASSAPAAKRKAKAGKAAKAKRASRRAHRTKRRKRAAATAAAAAGGGSAAAAGGGSAAGSAPASPAPRTTALAGTFRLAAGRFRNGRASGSYFRMIFPGPTRYFNNPDSRARNKTFTLVSPGSAGGLVTGRFQPHPSRVFDRSGNARARAIIRPQRFAGVKFSLATLPRDPQSGRAAAAPSFTATGGRIRGRLPSLTAEWNNQYFNQGAPKPGRSAPRVTGTYDPASRAFVLVWRSRITGGPFNGFTGSWHLAGTFSPR